MATRTVGPSGKDFTTIQAAYDASSAGDFIDVYAGTYTDRRTVSHGGFSRDVIVNCNKNGTNDSTRITIRAVEAGVVLDGQGVANSAFSLYQRSFNTITGGGSFEFEIINIDLDDGLDANAGHGVIETFVFSGSANHDNVIEDIYCHDCTFPMNATDYAVVNVIGTTGNGNVYRRIRAVGQSSSHGSGVRGAFSNNNVFEDCEFSSFYTGIYFSQDTANTGQIYRRNLIYDIGIAGLWIRDHEGGEISFNVVYNVSGPGIFVNITHALTPNHRIFNNTVEDCSYGVQYDDQVDTIGRNNLIINCGTAALRFAGGTFGDFSGCLFTHSVMNGNAAQYAAGEVNETLYVANISTSDPLIAAVGTRTGTPATYYALTSSSPCRGAGTTSDIDTGATDFAGNALNSPPDIGALQFQGAAAGGPLKVLRLRRLRRVA